MGLVSAQVAADLRAAADVLERDGWIRGSLHKLASCGGGHCALGAIHVATGVVDDWGEEAQTAYQRAADAERLLTRHLNIGPLPAWNDRPGRTADEVIAALRDAADRAEAEQ